MRDLSRGSFEILMERMMTKEEKNEIERKYKMAVEINEKFQKNLFETTKAMEKIQIEQAIEKIKKDLDELIKHKLISQQEANKMLKEEIEKMEEEGFGE